MTAPLPDARLDEIRRAFAIAPPFSRAMVEELSQEVRRLRSRVAELEDVIRNAAQSVIPLTGEDQPDPPEWSALLAEASALTPSGSGVRTGTAEVAGEPSHRCGVCQGSFGSSNALAQHCKAKHGLRGLVEPCATCRGTREVVVSGGRSGGGSFNPWVIGPCPTCTLMSSFERGANGAEKGGAK